MGASEFITRGRGKTAAEAFRAAVEEARYEDGHGGYTGTIAEKHEFKIVTPRAGETPEQTIDRCLGDDAHFCQDKWGACGAVASGPGEYIFFGWASS